MKAVKILMAATLLPLFFSCTEKENEQPEIPDNGGKEISVVAACPSGMENGFKWSVDAVAGIVPKDGETIASSGLSAGRISEDGQNARFTFKAEEGSYQFFYPYNADSRLNKCKFTVKGNQLQPKVGQTGDILSLMGQQDITLSKETEEYNVKTKLVGAYLRIHVFGIDGENVKSVTVSSENAKIAGSFISGKAGAILNVDGTESSVTVTLETPFSVKKEKSGSEGIYVAVLPENESMNTYKVVTDKTSYTLSSTASINLTNGKFTDVEIDLGKALPADVKLPEHLYLIGDATDAGWDLSKAVEMKREGAAYLVEANLYRKGEGFKFITEKRWGADEYRKGDDAGTFVLNEPKDEKFQVEKDGKYKIALDFRTSQLSLTLLEEIVETLPEIMYSNPEGTATTDKMKKESDGIYTAQVYAGSGEGKNLFRISQGDNHWNSGKNEVIDFRDAETKADALTYELSGLSANGNSDPAWVLDTKFEERYYDVTLDMNLGKITVEPSVGESFWLVGQFTGWSSLWEPDKSIQWKADKSSDGNVTWNVTIPDGSQGMFKFHGDKVVTAVWDNAANVDWIKGEWYQAQEEGAFTWNSETYGTTMKVNFGRLGNESNSHEFTKSWALSEPGDFTIVFNTKDFTLKVSKK